MPVNLHLQRFAWTPMGVFGMLSLEDGFQCYTVERPWLDNEPWVSCVPEGVYELNSARFRDKYDTFELLDVPGRTRIKIHIANEMEELHGCIGLGLGLGYVHGRWAVTSSGAAFDEFMEHMGDPGSATLTITGYEPEEDV